MGSVGQWAAKLLAFKVEVLKKKSATSAITAEMCASASARFRVRPDLNHSQSLTDSNFEALSPTDLILPAVKDLSLFSK